MNRLHFPQSIMISADSNCEEATGQAQRDEKEDDEHAAYEAEMDRRVAIQYSVETSKAQADGWTVHRHLQGDCPDLWTKGSARKWYFPSQGLLAVKEVENDPAVVAHDIRGAFWATDPHGRSEFAPPLSADVLSAIAESRLPAGVQFVSKLDSSAAAPPLTSTSTDLCTYDAVFAAIRSFPHTRHRDLSRAVRIQVGTPAPPQQAAGAAVLTDADLEAVPIQ
jgi:hypothetical protein